MNYINNPARRTKRRRVYPEYWDYRNPRTAQEYLINNIRRRLRAERKLTTFLQRLLACSVGAFLLALLI